MRVILLLIFTLLGIAHEARAQSPEAIECLNEVPTKRYSDRVLAEQKERSERARVEKQRLGFSEQSDHQSSTHVKPRLSKSNSIVYPRCAALFALSGECSVYFDLTASGQPKDIFAYCSDILFQDSAENAISQMMFEPATIDGVPVDYPGVVISIPFEFSIKSNEQPD